jgi:hypothetical protein
LPVAIKKGKLLPLDTPNWIFTDDKILGDLPFDNRIFLLNQRVYWDSMVVSDSDGENGKGKGWAQGCKFSS